MNTTYSDVYSWFLDKVSAYSLTMFTDIEKEEIVYGYLRSTCAKFQCCAIDLSDRNEDLQEFNNELDDEILDILSEGMIVAWLKPKLYNEEKLSNSLSTKDYSLASPANLLAKITEVYKLADKSFKTLKGNYTFYHGKLPNKGVRK